MARLVGPDGSVTGLDMDEIKLGLARADAAERGLKNVEFKVADLNDWHEPADYDVVYSRFVLQHLSRPVDLLRRMWAAVKLGGAIIVEDADFDALFCEPPNDGFSFYARTYPRVLDRYGGDATVGRKLYGYFREAGIPRASLTLRQGVDVDGEAKTLSLATLEATADAIVREQLASTKEVDAAIASLAAFTVDPTTLVGGPRVFQLSSRRSPSAGA